MIRSQNVRAGALYLKFLMDRFGQNVRLALAAYNAGEEAVDRNGGQIPPFSETMAYVPRVLKVPACWWTSREAPRLTEAAERRLRRAAHTPRRRRTLILSRLEGVVIPMCTTQYRPIIRMIGSGAAPSAAS